MADHYIRSGAAGLDDGSGWADAWPDFASVVWTRGDTYYVADGSYNETLTLSTAASSNIYIYIYKATVASHGSDTDWNDSYGDGQAVTKRWSISTDYWYISGITRTNETSGYGFQIVDATSGTRRITLGTGVDHISISYVDCVGQGEDTDIDNEEGLYMVGSAGTIYWGYMYVHDLSENIVNQNGPDYVFYDHCIFCRRHTNDAELHGQGIMISGSQYTFVYYCKFFDIYGTGAVVALNGGTVDNIHVAGCEFYQTNDSRYTYSGGIIAVGNATYITNSSLINNTIYDFNYTGTCNVGFNAQMGAAADNTGNYAYNNIWINCKTVSFLCGGDGTITHDYNLYDVESRATAETNGQYYAGLKTDLFDDYTNKDVHLKIATNTGYDSIITAPWDKDPDNVDRGYDTVWDRGEYEYSAGGTPAGSYSPF